MTNQRQLSGWGNFPIQNVKLQQPANQKAMLEKLLSSKNETFIPRGLGRSYGDTALNENGNVILQTNFNYFLEFNQADGVVTVEAGVSLKEILDVSIPRGFFLPVTPGTKFVTIGGALANDVHGKNHHVDGTIAEHVLSFQLATGTGEILRCSRIENSEVFWATIGGIGLTGIILDVTLRLLPIVSRYIEADFTKVENLDAAFEEFSKDDEGYQYSVAWIDCLATGKNLGKSVLIRGNHSIVPTSLDLKSNLKLAIPFNLPSFTLNRYTVKAFNELYYAKHSNKTKTLVDFDSFFYPLDSISHWNRLYGKKGFLQYQVAFPMDTSRDGLIEVLTKLSDTGAASFLAVLKKFGKQNDSYLSFPFEGYTLALDIPAGNSRVLQTVKELEEIALKYGGRIYTAKDAVADAETFATMYPRLSEFKEVQRNLDPFGIFSSSMGRRLGIVGGRL